LAIKPPFQPSNLTRRMRWIYFLIICSLPFAGKGQKVRDGETAWARKQYSVAIPMLQKEYEKAKTRAEKGKIAFKIGESCRILAREEQAALWYQKAYDDQFGPDALRELAFSLKRQERYEEAKAAFKELGIEIGSPYEYRREINACDVAAGWKKITAPEYRVAPMDFNTASAEYSPVLFKTEELVFTSDRGTSTGEDTYAWTGNRFSDLFLFNLGNNTERKFDTRLNSPHNEGTATFARDFTEVYFTRCEGPKKEDAFCRIMFSEYKDNEWTSPQALNLFENNVNYGHPSVSEDGSKIYFAANHPDGWGGYDLYVSEKGPEGWEVPKLLSRAVNTIGNEQFPYIHGDTLYFSSDFHPGMGGLDIFRTYRMANGEWAPAFNLKPPVNSGADDFGLVRDPRIPPNDKVLQTGYFTSNRSEGSGNDDIYRYEMLPEPPAPPVVANPQNTGLPRRTKLRLDIFVLEKVFANPSDPNSKVLGRKALPGAQLEIVVNNTRQLATVNEEGNYSILLDDNTEYAFTASKSGFLTNAARFSSAGIGRDPALEEQVYELEVVLDKIYLNKEIILENIYYDFDKWDIREDAKPTLNALAENLRLNPSIRIQLASHTDCRGNDAYNLELSQKRAQSAVDYLIAAGIDALRLSPKGFGETQPSVDCLCTRCTEEQHQANRRTTFAIVE
jgi:peptidoglycan-associated lipoprotein